MSGEADRRRRFVEACILGAHVCQIQMLIDTGDGDTDLFGDQGLSESERRAIDAAFSKLTVMELESVVAWADGGANAGIEALLGEIEQSGLELSDNLPEYTATKFFARKAPDCPALTARAVVSLCQVALEVYRDLPLLQNLFKLYVALGIPVCIDDVLKGSVESEFREICEDLGLYACVAPYDTAPDAWEIAFCKIQRWGERYSGRVTGETLAVELAAYPRVKECAERIAAMPAQNICVLGHSFTMEVHWSSQSSFTAIAGCILKHFNPGIEMAHVTGGSMPTTMALEKKLPEVLGHKPAKTILALVGFTAQHRDSLVQIITQLEEEGSESYVFDCLTPNFGRRRSSMSSALVKAAREAGAAVIPVSDVLAAHPNRHNFTSLDSIHMNLPYHKVMAVELVRFLAEN